MKLSTGSTPSGFLTFRKWKQGQRHRQFKMHLSRSSLVPVAPACPKRSCIRWRHTLPVQKALRRICRLSLETVGCGRCRCITSVDCQFLFAVRWRVRPLSECAIRMNSVPNCLTHEKSRTFQSYRLNFVVCFPMKASHRSTFNGYYSVAAVLMRHSSRRRETEE